MAFSAALPSFYKYIMFLRMPGSDASQIMLADDFRAIKYPETMFEIIYGHKVNDN